MFDVKLIRYSDPDRKYLAHAAAVYLGKPDIDNIKRPLNIMKKGDTLAIFRGESARFEFKTSKVVYDHLITYTTQNMRACGGLRANEATVFVPPVEDDDPIYTQIGEKHLDNYRNLIHGIDPQSNDPIKKKKLQAARSVAPVSVQLHYIFEFNFCTLIEAIFPQRIWTPGAQLDTKQVVQKMFELVREQDPELWDLVYELYGPEAQGWKKARQKLKKENPELYHEIMDKYGKMTSMWES
ncbi:FAD-dependent thymidylate synthase [Microaerobacter geothermalis]|uniref:FAD-dependent thymidylate synthase n=1 Tax=Microaerobacter geothermalis TaxID=674972 RepID=UPI001F20BE6F|nr:FAD-dependent thymidylate synthase [Microaerobacter geothermalis]MCF6092392.1 FAD-dependent thymidylate synthase [Microaerobacter geothermalis]